jgi:uncharacterized protein (TIGR02444 family)
VTNFPADAAWDFALRLYDTPGVAPACLDLQERHGIDVTLMLFCLWHGTVSERPLGDDLPAIAAAAQEWHRAAVLPIRAARRWLKRGTEGQEQSKSAALYRTVLAAEIDCEHAELLMLAQRTRALGATPGSGPFPATMAENLVAFFQVSGISLAAEDRPAVGALLEAAGAAEEMARILP